MTLKKHIKAFLLTHSSRWRARALTIKAKRWGLDLNLSTPSSFTDKINWLQAYDKMNSLKTICADKIRLHQYCQQVLGEDICVPIIKVFDTPEDIKPEELPDKFVLKCNHGWNNNILVDDVQTFNLAEAKAQLKQWLSEPFGIVTIEPHYINIPRKCFCEMHLATPDRPRPIDYKFHCLNGEPQVMQLVTEHIDNKSSAAIFLDMDFHPLANIVPTANNTIVQISEVQMPSHFEQMKRYARLLSANFRYVRIDFYQVGDTVYLGEMTFTPGAGFLGIPAEVDKYFGQLIKL